MHAENSFEMSKYFTRTNKIQILNSLMVCMILFMYVSLKINIFYFDNKIPNTSHIFSAVGFTVKIL